MIRCQVAHQLALRVAQPGLALERRVYFQKTVIRGFTVSVKDHFNGAKPLDQRLEESAIPHLGLANRLLGALALGYIARNLRSTDDLSVNVVDRRDRGRDLDPASVFRDPDGLEVIDPFAPCQPSQNLPLLVSPLRRNEHLHRLTDCLQCRESKQLLRAGIPAGDDSFQRLADDGVVGGFDDATEQLLAGEQLRGALPHPLLEPIAHLVPRVLRFTSLNHEAEAGAPRGRRPTRDSLYRSGRRLCRASRASVPHIPGRYESGDFIVLGPITLSALVPSLYRRQP